ncbi:hypothetical protein DPMN_151377 [Dreissena polymorpha]|uniref:Uncharacterized protein n=1 Tax=Dreissena polymorpha TaxID=45954 RepID=A0A9D4FJU9_DREPO|nr:hypothetical protein DPMN_151377 [Dreissena polymorpha]
MTSPFCVYIASVNTDRYSHFLLKMMTKQISKVPEPRDFFGYVWDNRIMPLFANSVAERSKHGRGSPNTKPPTHGQEKRRLKYFWKHLQETY